MLKKSAIAAALVMFTTSAFALDGGQLDFAGLVSDNTCVLHVNGGAQDGQITLQTATTTEVNQAGVVQLASPGAKPEAFSITIDCYYDRLLGRSTGRLCQSEHGFRVLQQQSGHSEQRSLH